MEDENINKHGKRKMNTSLGSVTIGGEGGITGLLVFGGALAIAGLMAVTSFATKRNKKKAITHPHHQQLLLDDDIDNCESASPLQYSTTQHGKDVASCLPVSSSELLSAQPLNLEEEKIDSEPNSSCFHHQEIAFSDYSQPESAASSNENGVAEECSASLLNNSTDHEQEEEKDEPQDGITTTETEEDEPQDGITTTEAEDNNDEYDDEEEDGVTETDEEDSSKATGNTTPDHLEHEFKKYYTENNVCSDLYTDGSHYTGNETLPKEAILNKAANFSMVQNDQQSIFTTWVMPMLFLGLLMILVLLTCGIQESLYVLDDADSVLVP